MQTHKMDRFSLKCTLVVLILVTLCFDISVCLVPTNNAENSIDANTFRENEEKHLWFGPRMGKKKRSEKFNDKNKISAILESLDEYPWGLVAVSDNTDVEKRGNTPNFTPRMGRTLDEGTSAEDIAEIAEKPAFSFPRFGRGRHFSPYSPRLGRDESNSYV